MQLFTVHIKQEIKKKILLTNFVNKVMRLNKAYEPRREKNNVLVSDMVQHKPGCTATEDG